MLNRDAIDLTRMRLIIRELLIEANFTLNFCYLKYKDKEMTPH